MTMREQEQRKNTTNRKRAISGLIVLLLCLMITGCGGGAVGHGGSDGSSSGGEASISDADIKKAKEEAGELVREISDSEINILKDSKADINAIVQSKAKELLGDVKIKVSGDYDVTKTGSYDLKVTLEEKTGAKASRDFVLTVIDREEMEGDYSFMTDNGFLAEVKDGIMSIDGTEIVNKSYSLPAEYGYGMTEETLEAYRKMEAAASLDGMYLEPISEYRSFYDQMYVHARNAAKYGGEAADTFSAKPGHSEHQLGEAMDLNSLSQSFADTPEGQWIRENCAEYGFILRYPPDTEEETGYMSEPWHIRYVGEELAKKLYNNGEWITVEKYFGIDSKYSPSELAKEESVDTYDESESGGYNDYDGYDDYGYE